MKIDSPIEVMHKYGKSFYWASFFLGREHTSNAAILYQFCRFLDDVADGSETNRIGLLKAVSESVRLKQDHPEPCVKNFLAMSKKNNLSSQPAVELIAGMLSDQEIVEITSERELLRYCHAVAGTVGVMMCKILGCKTDAANQFAVDLGIAMQLTNIARDVLEDASMGRRYLPSEWLSDSIKTDDIANINPSCKESIVFAIQKLLVLSEKYYLSALTGTKLLPVRSRFAIIVALRIYRAIGTKLAKNNCNWWMGRTIISKSSKLILTLRSMVDLFVIRKLPHEKKLHLHLKGLSGVDC